jgi:hypothetical protein
MGSGPDRIGEGGKGDKKSIDAHWWELLDMKLTRTIRN